MLSNGGMHASTLGGRWRPRRLDLWTIGLGVVGAMLVGLLAGAGLWIVGLALILMAAFVPLAIANPERMALGLIVFLPWMIYPFAVGGFSLFLAIPTFGFTSIVMLMRARGATPIVARALPTKLFAILLAFAIAASVSSPEPVTALTRTAYLVLFGFFAWALASSLVAGRVTREQVARAVLWSAGLAAIVLTFQFAMQFAVGEGTVMKHIFTFLGLFGGENAPPGTNWIAEGPDLLRGIVPFMTPASAGQYLMLATIVGFWLNSERRRDTSAAGSTLDTVMLVVVVVGLLVTFSRQSWLGAGVGVAALGLIRRPVWMITAVCAALLFTFVVPFPGGDGATFGAHLLEGADTDSQSTSRRIDLWERAVGYIPDHVIIGAGPGLFASIDPDPFHPILYAHNVFLDVAVELGLIAALVFIAILILGIRGGLMRGQRLPAAMLIAFAGASIFDDALYFPRNGLLVAIAFALILGGEAARKPGTQRVEEHEQPDGDGSDRHRSHRPVPRDREPVLS